MFISYSFHSEVHNFIQGFISLYVVFTNTYISPKFSSHFICCSRVLTTTRFSFYSWLSASSRFLLCCPQLNQMRKLKATKKAIIVKMTGRALEIPEDGLYCTIILLKSVFRSLQTAGRNSSRDMSQTVHIDHHSFLSRVRISVRPSKLFLGEKPKKSGTIHVNPERSFRGTNGEPPSEASQLRKGGQGVSP